MKDYIKLEKMTQQILAWLMVGITCLTGGVVFLGSYLNDKMKRGQK